MAKRKKISKQASKKIFIKAGVKTNSLNLQATPMRGGFRI